MPGTAPAAPAQGHRAEGGGKGPCASALPRAERPSRTAAPPSRRRLRVPRGAAAAGEELGRNCRHPAGRCSLCPGGERARAVLGKGCDRVVCLWRLLAPWASYGVASGSAALPLLLVTVECKSLRALKIHSMFWSRYAVAQHKKLELLSPKSLYGTKGQTAPEGYCFLSPWGPLLLFPQPRCARIGTCGEVLHVVLPTQRAEVLFAETLTTVPILRKVGG